MPKLKDPPKTTTINCSRCGSIASSPVPADTIVRAFVECPECVQKTANPIRCEGLIGHAVAQMLRNWPENASEPHYINMISESCGWNHMEPGEKITVHFGDGEYEIKRKK